MSTDTHSEFVLQNYIRISCPSCSLNEAVCVPTFSMEISWCCAYKAIAVDITDSHIESLMISRLLGCNNTTKGNSAHREKNCQTTNYQGLNCLENVFNAQQHSVGSVCFSVQCFPRRKSHALPLPPSKISVHCLIVCTHTVALEAC